MLNTLKEELVEIEAAAEESVHKVEEKDHRLAFIESIMDNLQTQAGGLKARVKAHSFKIKAEERVALLASSCLVNGVRCIGAGRLDASRLRGGYAGDSLFRGGHRRYTRR